MAAEEKVVEKVTMTDGRVVEFAGKRRMIKTEEIDGTSVSVRLDFRNGETRTWLVPNQAMVLRCAAHGASQKLGDEIAGEKDLDDAILAIDALMERLDKGEWGQTREGGGMSGTSVLLRALVEHTGKDIAVIKDFLAKKTQAEKLALRNNPSIKPIVDRLEAEKMAKKTNVDTDALLGELDAA